jgi:hypothetical protein
VESVGQKYTRIGFVDDGGERSGFLVATYEFDEVGVRLKVAYLPEDDRGRWWSDDLFVVEIEGAAASVELPSSLDYFDSEGSVGLIGCRAGGFRSRMGVAGVGTVHALYAVENAHEAKNYSEPHGLRSQIEGFAYWLGVSALKTIVTYKRDPETSETMARSATASTSTEDVEDVPLARAINLKAIAYASNRGMSSPEVTYRSQVYLETSGVTARAWDEHVDLHTAMRNLLRVASWRSINFQTHHAMSTKEPLVLAAETTPRWLLVRTARTGIAEQTWTSRNRFLFTYADVGRVGVSRWLKIVKDYERGVRPLVHLLDLKDATIDAHMAQLGIAVEAIGYQSLIESGVAPGAANRKSVEQRLHHLLTEVDGALTFPTANFANDFADSYNSVKHANRVEVPPATKHDHIRQGVQMLRAWVAIRLGVKPSAVKARW